MAQPLNWQKSSFSGGGAGNECVELAAVNGEPLLRESDEPDRILSVAPDGLAALLLHLRANRP
ncbi:hypothetical protein QFZ24_005101 [Streptomyces phaeochromogenes]|uniref:DUF397 domain-containing protein n=1 Tax=Streptomyces phaeochromogenes TaxID=1923 RepID=UPI00278D284D|nr:DUF397 domain-containing protein [Streptomyces phaeochromogenes]MDQ0951178.1 hypothetical protein [Streptomyces phaeochromogenes]